MSVLDDPNVYNMDGLEVSISHLTTSSTAHDDVAHICNTNQKGLLQSLTEHQNAQAEHPYSIPLYAALSESYARIGYPDLAVGAAYKALLLIDALSDEGEEFYDQAYTALSEHIKHQSLDTRSKVLSTHPELGELSAADDTGKATESVNEEAVLLWANQTYARQVYNRLASCLHLCGCERSAAEYCIKGLELFPNDISLGETLRTIHQAVDGNTNATEIEDHVEHNPRSGIDKYPDQGMVRRECYPWNNHEPDRCSDESLAFLNIEMQKVAPRLEVRATELPSLADGTDTTTTVKQLGVFAKEDVSPGEMVLAETSLLTANNRLQDALCDACSADLPELKDPAFADVVACPECQVVFCNQHCFDLANEQYHPAVCDRGVEDVAKNVPPAEAANTLYSLLLLRSLAMAETQECHPLDLSYVKYIWGDYHITDLSKTWESADESEVSSAASIPRTLPFSFQANVVLPFNMLEMMEIDIFANPQYDVWVFNTLFAKFRGTASARLSGLGGRPIRGPEVSAVHPMWCLANHSCDPNVTWRWASEVRFHVLEERVQWQGGKNGESKKSRPGLRKDEEVMSHYCDVDLPVKDRREWAAGSLGGACCCERCIWEAEQALIP